MRFVTPANSVAAAAESALTFAAAESILRLTEFCKSSTEDVISLRAEETVREKLRRALRQYET